HLVMFGSPLTTSYDRILVVINGVQETVSYLDFFNLPFYDGLVKILSDRSEGLVHNAMFSLIGLAGILILLLRNYPAALFIAASSALFFYSFAKFPYIYARFFSPFALAAAIPLAALLNLPFGRPADKAVPANQHHESRINIWLKLIPVFILVFSSVIFTIHFHTAKKPDSLAANLESLKVFLGDTPCDYFNMSHDRWECSHLDRGSGNFTGKAAEGDCAGFEDGMLHIPLNPALERRIEWRREFAKGSVLKIRYFNKGAEDINLGIRTSDVVEKTFILKRAEEPQTVEFPAEAGHDSISFIFPAAGKEGLSICLNAEPEARPGNHSSSSFN
ncbi:MAG: hypothetical protein FJ088_05685, partial [Deltaproteobacteria bacterium]|nr:hypothetical protein [Deltaproteobacteria bacterium]